MKVPFLDLKASYESVKNEILPAIENVLSQGQFILGERVESFEKNFADFCCVKEVIGVSSGTSAIHLALRAANIQPQDEVITVAHTFIATVTAICSASAKPVLVDVDLDYMTIDPSKILSAITPKTKAIIPVHLYGQIADMNSVLEIAEKYNLIVIEDACQAHGAKYNGLRAGSIGDIGCFSFYPSKNLGAFGDGGALVTNNHKFAFHARMLRNWGALEKYHHDTIGFNERLDEIQGVVLDVKLKYIDELNKKRQRIASLYDTALKDLPLITPKVQAGNSHVYHLYVIRTQLRDRLKLYLEKHGVQTGLHYPIPIHLQNSYNFLGYRIGDLPVSEIIATQCISLPMCPFLREEQIQYVIDTIRNFFK